MWTGTKNARLTHPNLLLLQAALAAAESGVPACPPRTDANEQRAAQLIAQMQAAYKRPKLFMGLQDIPSPQGVQVTVPALHPQAG